MYNIAVDVGGTFTDVLAFDEESGGDLLLFFHGTTVVTNMILTNTGSRVGLLTTKDHEQILHLARAPACSTAGWPSRNTR
jgi:N-methylhydantoinase A